MKEKKQSKLNLYATLIMFALIPLMCGVLTFALYSTSKMKNEIESGSYSRLRACAVSLKEYFAYDIEANGYVDYEEYADHKYIQSLLSQGIELTLFKGDTRLLTSLKNSDGSYNEGTQANADIYAIVKAGNDYKADSVSINGKEYYVYYTPIFDGDNNFWGMAFAGESEEVVVNAINEVTTVSIVLSAVLLVIFTVVALLVCRLISSPMNIIAKALNRLADGYFNDEIVASTHIKEIESVRDSTITLQQNLRNVVHNINTGMSDLTTNMDTVANAVNICNMAKDGISEAVEEMAKGATEMAESVQNAAEIISNMGENIDNISDISATVSNNAKETATISIDAKESLNHLSDANKITIETTKKVVDGIHESGEAVKKIEAAVQAITDIASQTNLLSLNASIEAARAGEAGKGFAVVASEISKLANQSDESAREIKIIVSDIIQASESNKELANEIRDSVENEGGVLIEVQDSFDKVSECLDTMLEGINNISEMATTLDANKNVIVDEISTLSSISEENAASAEETSASTEELGANIEDINTQTSDINEIVHSVNETISYFKN